MQYGDAIVVLEGMIKALESHIELAKKGLIQEDCIGCREKDLETYKGILEVLQKEHKDKNGWICLVAECRLETDKLNKALEIIRNKKVHLRIIQELNKESCNVEFYNKQYARSEEEDLTQEEFELMKEVMGLCPDSKIAK